MEKELKDLKSTLRSIVVSSPAQVDVRSLQRDYKTMMGSPIPIAKYGYRDVLLFLKERCNDSFLFQGLSSNPVLTLIVPDSLKHIDQHVRSQKPSAVTKMKGKRRSINESPGKPSLICQTYRAPPAVRPLDINRDPVPCNNILYKAPPAGRPPDLNRDPVPCTNIPYKAPSAGRPPDIKRDPVHRTNIHNIKSNIYTSRKELTKSTSNIKSDSGYRNSNSEIAENGFESNVRSFLKEKLPMYDSSQYLDGEACSGPDKASSKGDDSGRLTSSSHSSTKKAHLEELKCEIHELIKEHEEGIWCTDLMRLYRERYERELDFNRFGHNNINGLLYAMEDRVAVASEARGVRLRDAARAPAPPAPPVPRARALPHPPSLRALPVDPDDALPGIDFDPDVFPEDCMHFLESIPAQSLAALQPGAMLEVTVGEVYSPSHFWLQRLGESYSLAMDEVMDEMSDYYNTGAGSARVLARGALRPGYYCTSLYDRDWHRSLIIKVLDADTVKVRHVDYGTVDVVLAAELKPLLRRWATLPAQAVRARLAGLRPSAGGRRWPHAAATHFLHLVRDRRFIANVVALDPEEDTIEVFLIDTSGADDVCLSGEMVRAGHADARADSALRTAECYLYPRFDALESGDTPNYGEIHQILGAGLSLEYVEAYRRHVPAALPSPRSPLSPRSRPSPPPSPPPLSPRSPPSPPRTPPPRTPPPLEVLNRVPLLRLDSPSPAPPGLLERLPSPPAVPANQVTPAFPAAHPYSAKSAFYVAAELSAKSTLSATAVMYTTPLPALPASPAPYAAVAHTHSPARRRPPPAPLSAPPAGACCPAPAPTPAWHYSEECMSAQEWEIYVLLRSLDPSAAHCYMMSALRRAGPQGARPFVLNPHAPSFQPPGAHTPAFQPPGAHAPAFQFSGPPPPSYLSQRPPPGL